MELRDLTALELGAAIKKGEVSTVEAARAALDAIAAFRRQNRKDPRSKMVLKFLEVLENFLLGRKKTFERLASQLLLQLEKWRDLEVDLFVYQMLIDHYTGMEDEHSLCVIQAKLIDFLMR